MVSLRAQIMSKPITDTFGKIPWAVTMGRMHKVAPLHVPTGGQ